jgi:hypothetical protein
MGQPQVTTNSSPRIMGQARTIGRHLFRRRLGAERHQGSRKQAESENFAQPFRLLDLQKELRLMVYKEMDVTENSRLVQLAITAS